MGYPAGTTSTGGADDFDDGPGAGRAATADVGVLTVLDQEIRAVTAALRHMHCGER